MSSKLTKLPKPTRPMPFTVTLPHNANEVKAYLAVVVLANNTVEVYGMVRPQELALSILQAGASRVVQWHQQQAKGSGLVGLDGLPIPPATSEEGHA